MGRDRLGELAARLHDAQAQRDDLRREEEVDHVLRDGEDMAGADVIGVCATG